MKITPILLSGAIHFGSKMVQFHAFSWKHRGIRNGKKFSFDSKLLKRAKALRQKLEQKSAGNPAHDSFFEHNELVFPSVYPIPTDNNRRSLLTSNRDANEMRGFCNWVIPHCLMVGQYPGMTPEIYGPSKEDAEQHMVRLIKDAGINLFVCLQSEVPPQTDNESWKNGEIYLPPINRDEFPRPFSHYAPVAMDIAKDNEIEFWHEPLQDLSTPDSQMLQDILGRIISSMLEEDRKVYLHCWGGRGRAGVLGSCLASLLWPELDGDQILNWIQSGYETRAGAELLSPVSLQRSPQTDAQREFVKQFVVANQCQQMKKK